MTLLVASLIDASIVLALALAVNMRWTRVPRRPAIAARPSHQAVGCRP